MAKLFVTTYMLYNEGRQFESNLTGFWFDVEDEELQDVYESFVKNGLDSDPELMFTDFEDFPRELYSESLGESDYEKIKEYAELEDTAKEGYEFLVDHMGYEHDLSIRCAENVCFSDQSPKDYAYDYIEECYDLTPWIMGHLDFQSIANELMMENCIIEWRNQIIINGQEF